MITLNEAKQHIRVTGTDDDMEITSMIAAAQAYIEDYPAPPLAAMLPHMSRRRRC